MMMASGQYLRQKIVPMMNVFIENYTHKELFYIKKESQSDYIIPFPK